MIAPNNRWQEPLQEKKNPEKKTPSHAPISIPIRVETPEVRVTVQTPDVVESFFATVVGIILALGAFLVIAGLIGWATR